MPAQFHSNSFMATKSVGVIFFTGIIFRWNPFVYPCIFLFYSEKAVFGVIQTVLKRVKDKIE